MSVDAIEEEAANECAIPKPRGDDYVPPPRESMECWSYAPMQSIAEVVRVFGLGAKKYAPRSYRNMPRERWHERYDAAIGHLAKCAEDYGAREGESGMRHLAHAATNILILMDLAEGGQPV